MAVGKENTATARQSSANDPSQGSARHWTRECTFLFPGSDTKMIRVTRADESSGTVVTIDGQLSSDTIAIVETCCNQAKSNGKPVQLFLRHVTIVDHAGRTLLSRLAAEGVRLIGTGVYTSYLVQSLTGPEMQRDGEEHD